MTDPRKNGDANGFPEPSPTVAGTRLSYRDRRESFNGVVLPVDGNPATVRWDRDGGIGVVDVEELQVVFARTREEPGLSDDDRAAGHAPASGPPRRNRHARPLHHSRVLSRDSVDRRPLRWTGPGGTRMMTRRDAPGQRRKGTRASGGGPGREPRTGGEVDAMTMHEDAAGETAGEIPSEGESATAGRRGGGGDAGTCPDATECLRLLAEAHALLIPLSPLGTALYENWLDMPKKTDMVVEHYGNGGLIGCVPFYIEMVAVEIRYGGEAAEREVTGALGSGPLAVDEATLFRNWRTLWFPSNRREYKRKWRTPSGYGTIHGDFSWTIVWDPAAVWRAKRELDRTPDPHFVKIRKLFPTRAEVERRRKAGKDAGPVWEQDRPVFGRLSS